MHGWKIGEEVFAWFSPRYTRRKRRVPQGSVIFKGSISFRWRAFPSAESDGAFSKRHANPFVFVKVFETWFSRVEKSLPGIVHDSRILT